MGRWMAVACATLIAVCGPGCRAHQLQKDQDRMRAALLDLYTNQIMDNLIRAHHGMPIVQLDYSDITGTVTQTGDANAGGNQSLLTERNELAVTTLRSFTNFLEFGAGGSQENQLTITANPVLNNNEVYNAYLEFLEKPERLVVTCDPPPQEAAHIVRCVPKPGPCGGKASKEKVYYWVPAEYRYDFLRLSLVTTVQRGQPLEVPGYFENAVERVEDTTPENLKAKRQSRLTLHFAKPLPNDTGMLQAAIGDATYSFRLDRYTDPIDGAAVKRGDKISRLWLVLPQDDLPADFTGEKVSALLLGKKVRIDLDNYRPTLPTTDDLLKSLRRNVNLIRLNQVSP